MPVDPNSHVPIYEQIVEHIRGLVAAGVYRPGEALPSIRGLALDLVVNPNTVQRAYQELQREGLIVKRKGLGAFVAQQGDTSAQRGSESAVLARFADGIQTGRAASMSQSHIMTIFNRALRPVAGESAPDQATSPEEREDS